ncbi:efflux RND transporter periplasmic adaptor subunit [Vibrio splendidus]|uniref:Efflux transporter periplasmic adaptor subunit n=2 Tax=Vibrio TaxID=662 RepID=A0A2N7FLS3_VIBSP|nr:efflux RND transporter periplasmic adaptor subunit [Vibrio splendidus]PMH03029.1 efflux transporter periplasmic adaptor subunit [Vibrio splendidus]PMJ70205.1 efflux transporter periplasmic adaptor subunit [Vibrio splendidus]PMJ93774.1 efflux transporter periplasmic adaptor subunit [Vibrio splendidus]
MMSIYRYSLLAATLLPLIGCNQSVATAPAPTKEERPIQVIQLEPLANQTQKSFTGKLQSSETAGVAFRVPGTIQSILVSTGDTVIKGQPLAELDPHDYQVALEELQARALEAKSAHKLAKAELARVQQAIDDNAIADVNLDRAISGYERSEAAVKVVEQNIRRAKDSIRYTQLLAPFDGIVASSNFDQYEQVLPGVSVFTIHNPEQLEVKIDVPENLIHQFSPQQQSHISWYGSQQDLTAYATEISTQPHPIKQTYSVTYRLAPLDTDKATGNLLPGKAVTLSTHLGERSNNFCLPYSAIVNQSGIEQVFTVENEQAQGVMVNVVSLNKDTACVESTLKKGDYVVVSGSQYVIEGQHFSNIQVKTL